MPRVLTALLITLACLTPSPVQAGKPGYVWAKAWHSLPGTHSDESGYFSLCEGLDGTLYVGTAKYGENACPAAFDPRTEKQRIVIDTHKLCGLQATGYAAQAKIHTRNFVGPSGKIYCGSKQDFRREGDRSEYPGGYLMVYDPRTSQAENLGMPLAGQGLIDVTADERRGLIYVVTCEDQHWMLYDTTTRKYRELGPRLTPTTMDRYLPVGLCTDGTIRGADAGIWPATRHPRSPGRAWVSCRWSAFRYRPRCAPDRRWAAATCRTAARSRSWQS
jgi:hypothetical protein